MNSPYGLRISDNCEKCPLRKTGHFCCLAPDSLRELSACSHSTVYPQHAVLTAQGQAARGVFIVCQGRVKLTSMSKDGKSVILRIVQAGEVIGLSAVVANRAYESSAETLVPSQTRFVAATDFLRIIRNYQKSRCMPRNRSVASASLPTKRFVRSPWRRAVRVNWLRYCCPGARRLPIRRVNSGFTLSSHRKR